MHEKSYTVTPQLALLFLYEVVILESTGTQSSIADHATVEGMLATPGDAGEILAILEKDDEDGVASPLDKGDLDSVNTEIANSWAMHLSLGTNQDVQLSPGEVSIQYDICSYHLQYMKLWYGQRLHLQRLTDMQPPSFNYGLPNVTMESINIRLLARST